jgi:outer membrane immunogenic protein
MRRFAMAALAVLSVQLALVQPAQTADPVPSRRPVAATVQPPADPAPPVEPWYRTGFYVGAFGGYDSTILEAEGVNLGNGELMAGPFIGWGTRLPNGIYTGLEVDWAATKVSGSTDVGGVTLTASHQHLISARARVGMPLGPVMPFVTFGGAWQQTKIDVASLRDTEWQFGIVAGGGLEWEFTRALFVRAELLHYMFKKDDAPFSAFVDSENSHTVGRAAVGFKLN